MDKIVELYPEMNPTEQLWKPFGENFEKPLEYTTFYMFIHIIIYYENFNRLRAEGGVQAGGTAWRSAGGDQIADGLGSVSFSPIVGDMYDNRSERGGRPNIDEVVMVKLLVLQQWYGL
jgi:hypothetical protein